MYFPPLKYTKINAITLWKWVLYAMPEPSAVLINHERIHLMQIRRDGVLRFYAKYVSEYFILRKKGLQHDAAYRGISYEKEAYEHDHDLTYQCS